MSVVLPFPKPVAGLRARIEEIEGHRAAGSAVLPFGIAALDGALPGGGLPCGRLHEAAGGGRDANDGAAVAAFVAGIAARTTGAIVWCVTRADLFPPGLAAAGLAPDRVLLVSASEDRVVLAVMEEALRSPGVGAVVGEVSGLSLTASRRLQLAAETSGAIGLALRRSRRAAEAGTFGEPTAATTRWRISTLPSGRLPVPGVGRSRWRVELLRVRGGEPAEFILEATDATGRLSLPADLADGSGALRGARAGA
ncbi:ImuA family protein [Segnochrobactraceae bacterium EtOH-i3]